MAEPGVGSAGLRRGTARAALLSWDEYSAQWNAVHVGPDARRSRTVVRGWLRLSYGAGVALSSLRPGTVTAMGVALSAAVPVVALFRGYWLFVAAGLVVGSAVADSADGAVAVLTSRTTRVGAYLDSMADRVAEAAWLLALWLVGAPGVLVTACGALAWLHEYARARAAAAGMPGVGVITVAERPTRVIAVVAALVLGGLAWMINPHLTPGAVTIVLAVWLVLGLTGALRLSRAIRTSLTLASIKGESGSQGDQGAPICP